MLHHITVILIFVTTVTAKSTIEPCSTTDTCTSLLGYTLYTDLKVSELASLFQIDPYNLLAINSIDMTSSPDVTSHILPSQLYVKIPVICSCADGIRKSVNTHYKTRPSDTLSSIADSVYGGLVSSDQIKDVNDVEDSGVLDVGMDLKVPLPCTCFNGTDNNLPAVYLSYVVRSVDTLAGIAARYKTTVTDVMTVNSLGNAAIEDGDILAVPLSGVFVHVNYLILDVGQLMLSNWIQLVPQTSQYMRRTMDYLYPMEAMLSPQVIAWNVVAHQGAGYIANQLHYQFLVQACNAKAVTSCLEMLQFSRVVPAAM
ncbi:LysM domain-containing GPI-anchored protein 1-like protein [Tanacetum coccineum]